MSSIGYEHLGPQQTAVRMATYAAIAEAHRRTPVPDDLRRVPLTRWESRVFAQNGEDGVLGELLRRIGPGQAWFCEFGVGDGREFTCLALAELHGWSGLVLEADTGLHVRLAQRAAAWRGVRTRQALVTPSNVADLLAEVPRDLDVLCIDVDGADYWMWEALGAWEPRIVVVEYNAGLDPAQPLVQPRDHGGWDGTDYFGASIAAFEQLGAARGYRLVHTDLTGTNAFFVRRGIADDLLPDRDVVPVHAPNYLLTGLGHAPDPKGRSYVRP
jgi:hypothetical protein